MAEAPQQAQPPQAPKATRMGSRWVDASPSEEDVREWFEGQSLHQGMEHAPYMGGIVLIAATEKVKVTKLKANGDPFLQEIERLVYVPYVKVDTRIAYFREYVRVLNGGKEFGDFIGVIEAVEVPRIKDERSAYFNGHLPDGYAVMPVRNNNDSISRFLVGTFRVAIYERQSYAKKLRGEQATPILQGVGTKQTPLARAWADDNALMKAETGAIGRALGVAGILVVGTGVATAEDMQEQAAGPSGSTAAQSAATPGESAALPADAAGDPAAAIGPEAPASEAVAAPMEAAMPEGPQEVDARLREQALAITKEFQEQHPEAFERYKIWWRDRFKTATLNQLTGPPLKGAVLKLERSLDEARNPPSDGVQEPTA